jgi:phosphoglycolate phosphatase
MMTVRRLVLFDVDGTLLRTGGAGMLAIKLALEQVYGTSGVIDSYKGGGRSVAEITHDSLAGTDIPADAIERGLDRIRTEIVTVLERLVAEGNHMIRPCVGAPELVNALRWRKGILLGLLTGNTRPYGMIKLREAGYDLGVFRVGVFGDDAENRPALLRLARRKAKELVGTAFPGQQTVLVGDTLHDIACTRTTGARSLIAATGDDSLCALADARPDYLFENLTDTEAIVSAILAPCDEDVQQGNQGIWMG